MAGSEVAITVESMFSMNSATATISGTTRSLRFDCMRGLLAFRWAGLQPFQTLGRLLERRIELERLAEVGDRAFGIARRDPPPGISPKAAAVVIAEVLDSIGETCPECPESDG